MDIRRNILRLIKMPYWLGIITDASWAIALFFPFVFGVFIGNSDFDPEYQTRFIMMLGGILMTGWTFLLIWAVRKPLERRVVILITAFPVVFGLFVISLFRFLAGNTFILWILIKLTILFVTMVASYILSEIIIRKRACKNKKA